MTRNPLGYEDTYTIALWFRASVIVVCVWEPHAVFTEAMWAGLRGSLTSKMRNPSNPFWRNVLGTRVAGFVPETTGVSTAVAHAAVVTGSSMDWIRSRRLFAW
ncbi:MAG: hypothetical protein ACR2GV_04980 [Gaiellaceae bacterium]